MKSEKQLYQWDVNQRLTELQPEAQFVDYPMGNEVIRIETDGKRCRIPDEFLQTAGFKTCYERYSDGTYKAYNFNVQSSPKPPDYVYTAEERTTFDALVAKADAAIAEIKRRADSGEFTPVKGVDYFTEAEKNELMESVSTGAIGEFRKVVDSATTEYNDNHNLKLAKYNANASEKLTTYDTNAEQHTTDYNRNAAEKLEAYNQNHAAKVAEYDANAETKTAEFDSNAAALQTEVDRLRGECDNLAAENRKQENRISALLKLNKGQTYDILPEEGETTSRTAPSGAKYVSVDKVGGKSVVWNQLLDYTKAPKTITDNGITYTNNMDGTFTATGTAGDSGYSYIDIPVNVVANHTYLSTSTQPGNVGKSYITGKGIATNAYDRGNGALSRAKTTGVAYLVVQYYEAGQTVAGEIAKPQLYDLTQMFGAGNEPTIEQFKKMFAQKIYPYNSGEIISSTTAIVELEGKNLWDDSNPAFMQVLLNAGFLYNSGVWHTNTIVYSSVNIGAIPQQSVLSYDILADAGLNPRIELFSGENRILSRNLESTGKWIHHNLNIPSGTVIDRIVVDYASRGMCKIKNIQLERGTTETAYSPHTKQSLSTGFPELHSAGTAHDAIDMDGGQVIRNVYTVEIETLQWRKNADNRFFAKLPAQAKAAGTYNDKNNELCNTYESKTMNELFAGEKGIATHPITGKEVWIYDNAYETPEQLITSLSGAVLRYELETPTTEPVTIPEPLQEWLPVEPGGTVTFRNSDESKQLAVPNSVSWVRKLDEVE